MNESPRQIKGAGKTAEAAGYRVLARKYRPASFDDLIGQDAMVRTLSNAFESGRIAQAYILTGVRGVGKTTTARILARALNYEPPEGGGAPTLNMPVLGRHCEAIMEGRHIDVIEMDAASHNGVDDVRQITDAVRYTPVNARYKIYILDEVHMLSTAAFNALLKTLEEPPAHAKFIFATTEIRKVPVTVLSRCQRFDLRRVDANVLTEHLAGIAEKEKITTEPEALAMIARAAEGSVRDALSILDQAMAHGEAKVTAEDVRGMLGLADRTRVIDLFEALMKGDIAAALGEFRAQYDTGAEPAVVIADLAEFTHLVTCFKLVPDSKNDKSLVEAERKRGSEFAAKLSVRALSRTWQILAKGLGEVNGSEKPMQAAEMVLVRLAYASDLPTPDEALRMLKDGSGAVPSGGAAPKGAPASAPRLSLAVEGGSRARPIAQTEYAAEAVASGPRLSSLEDVATLASDKRDLKIKHAVENYLRLVRIQEGRLEIALAANAPHGITQELSGKLTEWTGKRWFVALSDQKGGPTIAETLAAQKIALVQDVRSDPLVAAVLARFPGAEIVDVRPPKPLADEDEIEDLHSELHEQGDD
ncbi:MAG TPA: DNA polymerase III subunit gamma/tau [Xanthobacteraceae bacterium]|jgi:DNA polymerase-3 subunit gamma/tau|nr:DNA polymerase III subunit gamma/tau [Xanthobacteraceae bacterium]